MYMSKCSWSMFFLFFIIFISFGISCNSVMFHSYFFPSSCESGSLLDLSISLDWHSSVFILMVSVVVMMVLLYSELYMETYNNKKFFMLLIMFFLSMMFLSLSSSLLMLMVGWDGLGITSICLIMFYPSSNNTTYNSIMTMIFNRLGDCLLILVLSSFIMNPCFCFYSFSKNFYFFLLLMFLCSFSKSAQFPLSSWLPAAMSAPTPISAMVHSSTLVTAGVFLNQKMVFYFESSNLTSFLMFVSFLTFLVGGFLANLEVDFKKIIAFSTMSQISVIMCLISMMLLKLSCFHMFLHALFKTLLFCCSGLMFLSKFSDQFFSKFSGMGVPFYLKSLTFVSVFSMTGLLFCSSFYSKDLAMEFLINESSIYNCTLLILGSMLTVMYCCNILETVSSCFNHFSSSMNKSMSFFVFSMFGVFTLVSGKFMKYYIMVDLIPLLKMSVVMILNLILFMVSMFKFMKKSKILSLLPNSIMLMKVFSYSLIGAGFEFFKFSKMVLSDHTFMKPSFTMVSSNSTKPFTVLDKSLLIFLMVVILMLI